MKQRLIYILTTMTLLLVGCVNERVENVDMYTYNMVLRFNPSVANTDDQENKMETVQLIMVRDGEVIYDKRYTDGEVQQFGFGYTINSQVKLPLGDYDVYVICNLDKVENSNHATNFPAGIAVSVPGMIYSGTEDIAIPMYGKTTCKVEADTPLSIVFDEQNPLNRLMSKITLDFKTDGGFAGMKVTSISINNFCEKVKLGTEQGHEAPSATTTLVCTMPTDAPLILPAVGPATFYIPETYVTDPNHPIQPYIEVNAIINNDKTGGEDLKTKYKLKIETNTPNAQDKSYVRNTQYDITATVKGYGEVEDMFVKVNVLPWNLVSVTDEVGRIMAFSRATHQDGAPLLDYESIYVGDDTIKIYCITDVGGWYACLYDRAGQKIEISATTPLVSVKTEQSVKFHISRLSRLLNHDEYVVDIFHPVYAPEASGNRLKRLHYVQADGMIFNRELKANGWTSPPGKYGMQVARRGNVLPKDEPLAADPKRDWSTTLVFTGVTSHTFGAGKSNTAALVALGPKYQMAAYCVNILGQQWYLPSLNESKIMQKNHVALGNKYSFDLNELYQSSSESDALEVYNIFYNDGMTGTGSKTGNAFFRCVRDL